MSERTQRHGTGWYVGAAAFWLIAFWLVGVGLASIIPQIFWPAAGEQPAPGQTCRQELLELRRELLATGAEGLKAVAEAPAQRDGPAASLRLWDKRYAVARQLCTGGEQEAWVELGRIRHGLSSLVQGFQRVQGPRIQRMEAALGMQTSRGRSSENSHD